MSNTSAITSPTVGSPNRSAPTSPTSPTAPTAPTGDRAARPAGPTVRPVSQPFSQPVSHALTTTTTRPAPRLFPRPTSRPNDLPPHARSFHPSGREVTPVTLVRPGSPSAWEVVARLLDDYFAWLAPQVGLATVSDVQPKADVELADPARVYDRAGATFLLALQGSVAVGTVAVLPAADDATDGTAELCRFYTRPSARGIGVGAVLLQGAIDAATAHGYRSMILETCPGFMGDAIRLYARFGFEPSDEPVGVPVDGVVRYRRPLLG